MLLRTSIQSVKSGDIAIGIDLGATIVRLGALTPSGELTASREAEIRAEEGPAAGLERITSQIAALLERPELQDRRLVGIGVGSTGPTDTDRGLLLNPLTMPGWLDVPIVAALQERFKVPVSLENDADAAALGEYWQGAARPLHPDDPPVRRLYAVTVGTGVGTAFIHAGQVVRGAQGFHPEGGHMVVDPSGPECYCGGRGCLESLCSGTAIGRSARQRLTASPESGNLLLGLAGGSIEAVDARLVAEAARQGDPLASQVISDAANGLALGIFNILMLFYPEMIVLSGGVMRSSDLFMPAVEKILQAASGYVPVEPVRILPARLGYFAGVYGAAFALLTAIHYPLSGIPEAWKNSQ